MQKWSFVLVLALMTLTGCASTLEVAKGMESGTIWAAGGFVLLCCLGAGIVLHGWPSLVKVYHTHKHTPLVDPLASKEKTQNDTD
jgi:ascorbate-specific PTS system EIIC-type component UlaA